MTTKKYPLELSTMPGFAGSSAYYLRYQDPHNPNALVSKEANDYWRNVDLYIGGTEHATGHLIYSRFWNKFLFDIGVSCEQEPFKKLVNQGMIQGRSNFVYRVSAYYSKNEKTYDIKLDKPHFVSFNYYKSIQKEIAIFNDAPNYAYLDENGELVIDDKHFSDREVYNDVRYQIYSRNEDKLKEFFDFDFELTPLHVDINLVSNDILDVEKFRAWRPEFADAEFILEDGNYICGWAIEKMSKSYHNVVNPDDIVEKYGADTLRLYEMFLGPLEQSKPWDMNGIDGVHRFLRKLWNLFYKDGNLSVSDTEPTKEELKSLHKLLKKVTHDIENFSFNTSVSAFMICVNELTQLKCNNRAILRDLLICLSPFAPHIAEELWHAIGKKESILNAKWVEANEDYLIENSVKYPISFNGKVRFTLELPADMGKEEVEKTTLEDSQTAKYLDGKAIKKIIVVPGKIVNVVL